MEIKAHAKINLSLDVTGKRADGYHLLKMVMQSIELHDRITLEKGKRGIRLSCNLPFVPVREKNIAWQAARLFLDHNNIRDGVTLHIEKQIPVGAGLAGGSSNAAAVLLALNGMYGNPMDLSELQAMGLKLGADVPFTMQGGTALCEGVGEIITPLPDFSDVIVLLVKPPFSVSTRNIFGAFRLDRVRRHPRTLQVVKGVQEKDLDRVAKNLGNVLENVTLNLHPELRQIKGELKRKGALGSLMSGSGPTVFGLFDDEAKALTARDYFRGKYKETFLTRTRGSLK